MGLPCRQKPRVVEDRRESGRHGVIRQIGASLAMSMTVMGGVDCRLVSMRRGLFGACQNGSVEIGPVNQCWTEPSG
jgi:hypothetical protein